MIYKFCNSGDIITLEIINDHTYEKCYFSDYSLGDPLINPKRIKLVNCAQQLKDKLMDIHQYFNYLVAQNDYAIMN